MKLTFLGTGTSSGVPVIGCHCAVCESRDPRDRRYRTSALLETATTRILIDCGPDFREQILSMPFRKFDGVLLTHAHYDHVGGLDDLRPFCKFGDVQIYGNARTVHTVEHNFPYCFAEHPYPNTPKFNMHVIRPHERFSIGDVDVMPIEVVHDNPPAESGRKPLLNLGYRFGSLAYITDMKTIADTELPYLDGVGTLVVNALRWDKPHHSHQLVADAIAFSRRIGAKRTFIIHMTHQIGLHEDCNRRLPEGFELAYDGEEIEL